MWGGCWGAGFFFFRFFFFFFSQVFGLEGGWSEKLTGVVVEVVEVQCVVISCCGEGLIDRYGEDGEVGFEVEALGDAGDELVEGDVQAVAR